jgi:hypothetical protein
MGGYGTYIEDRLSDGHLPSKPINALYNIKMNICDLVNLVSDTG